MLLPSNHRAIVFIHGLLLTSHGWGKWPSFFRARGYRCHTVTYPAEDGSLTLELVVNSLVSFIDELPEPPILIGHSLGGLIAQKLVERGRGVAAVVLGSALPAGLAAWNLNGWWAHRDRTSPWKRELLASSRGDQGRIDFRKPHAPLLFIAGERDRVVPPRLCLKNLRAYLDQTSTRDLAVFPDRTHNLCHENGWEDIALFVDDWLKLTTGRRFIP
jgi:pimeloyl-ACP methyl ester carboxylesterase